MDRRNFLGAMGSLALLSPSLGRAAGALGGGRVTGLRLDKDKGAARLTLDLSGDARYQLFTLPAPQRVVIDVSGVAPLLPAHDFNWDDTPVADIRTGPHGDGVRIVLDMRQGARPQARMRDGAIAGQRQLIVQLPAPDGHMVADAQAQTIRPAIIAIDPGHGGKDPGAVSASDHYEKYVAFAVASRLHDLLKADPMFQPTLTRDSDYFIPLRERVLIAHDRKADMFVSVHADAAPERSARGASVYVLSEHGATSAMARWLAESENSSDKYESLRDSALYNKNPMVAKVLVDMSLDATITSSLDLGRLLINDLGQVTRIHQHHVDQAAFAVLKSPDIPSVLVETGFMSNRDDCRRLLTDSHQEELAKALHSGIGNYFHKFPIRQRQA